MDCNGLGSLEGYTHSVAEQNLPELAYWLAISESPLPPQYVLGFYCEHGNLHQLWNSSPPSSTSLDLAVLRRYEEFKARTEIDRYLGLVRDLRVRGIQIVRYVDDLYPRALRISSTGRLEPPLILLLDGHLAQFDDCVAVVGTRSCSSYGRIMARETGATLARSGYDVVSGLARGVDTEAHRGALDVDGRTVAVLAWLDPVYPPENRALLESIKRRGAALSERYRSPPGKASHLFIERNRITSGISSAVVVVESGREGGAIWQSEFAKAQGKPVYVLKPRESDTSSLDGYNYLVGNGAQSVGSPDELMTKICEDLPSRKVHTA